MKKFYDLTQHELAQAVADFVARKVGHDVEGAVSFDLQANGHVDIHAISAKFTVKSCG